MCGRFTQARPWSELVELYRITETPAPSNLPPRYNIAPTDPVPVVRTLREGGDRELVLIRWGLIPFWAKDMSVGARMINARAEGVAEKPAFREAFRRRRCLVIADGFYEWRQEGKGRKQPYYITTAGYRPFAFAGLWDAWAPPGGQRLESCAIVTTMANETVAPLHDRMPVMLDPSQFDGWLDRTTPLDEAKGLLKPYDGELVAHPVTPRVNKVQNDDAECIRPVDRLPLVEGPTGT